MLFCCAARAVERPLGLVNDPQCDDSGEDLPTTGCQSKTAPALTARLVSSEARFISLFVGRGRLCSPVLGVRHRLLILSGALWSALRRIVRRGVPHDDVFSVCTFRAAVGCVAVGLQSQDIRPSRSVAAALPLMPIYGGVFKTTSFPYGHPHLSAGNATCWYPDESGVFNAYGYCFKGESCLSSSQTTQFCGELVPRG